MMKACAVKAPATAFTYSVVEPHDRSRATYSSPSLPTAATTIGSPPSRARL